MSERLIKKADLGQLLNSKYEQYNCQDFIKDDPISIPHQFTKKQDIEIAAFFAAILAWGQRKTIINKCNELMQLMWSAPYEFVLRHTDEDLQLLGNFKHRTFNSTDLLYFIHFLKRHYSRHDSLEDAFIHASSDSGATIEQSLIHFREYFIDDEYFPARTGKHIASPARNSTCKRLVMFLRWMVRKDDRGVDFGLWKRIRPAQLVCPCDVHVQNVARRLGLLTRKQSDWKAALELTEQLRKLDANDPVKYDFALFGMGVNE